MKLAATIKRAPKWAWYTAGGLGIAAAVVKLYNGRDAEPVENVAGEVVGDDMQTGIGGGAYPGVIVPPVVIGAPNEDTGALGGLSQMYMEGVNSVFGAWEGMLGPVMGTQQQLLLGNAEAIQQIAMAGGAPQSVPTPVVSQEPIPQAIPARITPAPARATAPKVSYENRTRTNGKSGKQRAVWCSRVKIHTHADGRRVVVSESKIKNGAC